MPNLSPFGQDQATNDANITEALNACFARVLTIASRQAAAEVNHPKLVKDDSHAHKKP